MEGNTVWSFSQKAGWKLPGIMKGIDPQKTYDEIYGDGESRTLSDIVDLARNKKSAMHNYFEWDNKIASEKYRVIQAQRLVKNFVLIREDPETKEEEKTVFRLVEADSSRTGTYKPVKFFYENKDEYEKLLDRAKIELEGIKNRYQRLTELDSVIDAIDEFLRVS